MRIAIWHNLPSGGGKRALQHQVRELVRRGHFVKAWTPPTSCQSFADIRPFSEEIVVPLPQLNSRAGVRYKGRRAIAVMMDRLDSMVEHCRACASQIHGEKFDVLLAHPCGIFRATPIGGLCDLPAMMYLQEPFRSLYEASPELPWTAPSLEVPPVWPPAKLRWILGDWCRIYSLRLQVRAELEWMRQFDSISVNSLFSRESVLRAYGLESRVVYLGIDTDLFSPRPVTKRGFVVGLGSMNFGKGMERAIDAIAAIPVNKRPPLVWIGNAVDPTHEKLMHERARAGGVELSTQLMVDDEVMIQTLSAAACMIYTPRLEPFGFAPLEACACGTPAVGIAEGGVRETIVHGTNGYLAWSNDSAALGTAVESLTSNLEHSRDMGARARDHVLNHWTWEKSGEALEQALLETVAGREEKRLGLSAVAKRNGF